MIVQLLGYRPLRVGMPPGTLRVPAEADAERPLGHSHAERGNELVEESDLSGAANHRCLRSAQFMLVAAEQHQRRDQP